MVLLYPVSAKAAFVSPFAVTIGGVEYILSEDGKTGAAHARIDTVRGENLPSELYIPDKVEYNGKNIRLKVFPGERWMTTLLIGMTRNIIW